MQSQDKIYVAGGQTLVGSALLRQLAQDGYLNVVPPEDEPDLTQASQVDAFFREISPEYVFVAAGNSGGIAANQKYPAELMRHNLLVDCNVVHSAYRHGAKKLLYLASSCVYPRDCPQPMMENALLTGPLEPTNEAYAVAKIAGIKLCEAYRRQFGANFISVIPANVFGPGNDYGTEDSHVIGALLGKMHAAKIAESAPVEVWGSGDPQREFIFVDDLANACIFVMREYDGAGPINIGSGTALSVRELAELTKETVGYSGHLRFDTSRPDGMPLKVLDSGVLKSMGWQPQSSFKVGLQSTYRWLLQRDAVESA